MAKSEVVALCIALFNEIVERDEVSEAGVELINAVCHFAEISQVVQIFELILVDGRDGTESDRSSESFHLEGV